MSHADPQQIVIAAEVAQSFALDNGAFSVWKQGIEANWLTYYEWVEQWRRHPGFDWAIIPDVIEGDEAANDALLAEWPFSKSAGVPVWHFHESLERLARLANEWPRVALGSSGQYADAGDGFLVGPDAADHGRRSATVTESRWSNSTDSGC